MKSRVLNSIVVMAIFVVLAIPATIAAQTEQEQHNNQIALKNLDTLGDASAIAECGSGVSFGIAETRPDANTNQLTGFCNVDPSTHKLNGYCVVNSLVCLRGFRPQQCPVGAQPLNLEDYWCKGQWIRVDYGRRGCF